MQICPKLNKTLLTECDFKFTTKHIKAFTLACSCLFTTGVTNVHIILYLCYAIKQQFKVLLQEPYAGPISHSFLHTVNRIFTPATWQRCPSSKNNFVYTGYTKNGEFLFYTVPCVFHVFGTPYIVDKA